jgi:hypothetical protein
MMNRKTLLSFVLALLLALPVIGTALAAPPVPASFYGTVTVNGANVPDGTEVTAWINGEQYGVITSQMFNGDSVYGPLDVLGDDPDTTDVVEGGVANDTIVFKVNGQDADQTATWQSGGGGALNLTASGGATPTPTPTPPPSGSVIDGDNGQATVSFAGTRTIEMEDIVFSEINPNGEDFIATVATDDLQPWLATHTAANSGGWHVTLSATGDFSDGASHSIALDAGDGINGFTVRLPDDDVTGRSGSNSKPLSQTLTKQIVSTTGISILSAATGTGEGIYDFIPQFELFIPDTTIGGNYSTTVEVKMVFGP